MSPNELTQTYSNADVLAIESLFKRLAARGRAIRIHKQAVNLDQAEKPITIKVSSTDQDGTDPEALSWIGGVTTPDARPREV
jgi:hypothetical protein